MPTLRTLALGFSFETGRVLFHDVDLQLTARWTGLVGSNGAGKTTLLELLGRARAPTEGRVELKPPGATVARCDQRVEALDDRVRELAERCDGVARALHGRLRLDPSGLARWPTLSPGERRRWQLGAVLASEPDVLLLDEPTNHLDRDAADWLLPELRRFRGVGVLASHDRALLDALTTSTLRLSHGEARLWPGGWSQARSQWEREEQGARAEHDEARTRLDRAERKLLRARVDLAGASAQRSTGKRMKNKHDSDARTLAADFRAEQAEKSLAGRLRAERHGLEQAKQAHAQTKTAREVGADFELAHTRAPRPHLLSHAGRHWGRDDRVWLRGPNGSGKTTLLHALAQQRRPADALFYLPQELTTADVEALLKTLGALEPAARGRVLQWLAVLGVPPRAVLDSRAPSAGEARKLALALALGQPHWGLLLDEPTHHLDAQAIERLEAALTAFPGALLLATHEERFARACTTTLWDP